MVETGGNERSSFLRNVLKANAVFSSFTGTLLLIFPSSIASAFGFTAPIFSANPELALRILGISLLIFAGSLAFTATRKEVNLLEAWIAVILDELWVLGSILVLLINIYPINFAGKIAISAIALFVGLLSILQFMGIKSAKA
ncbi:MAG: hypothetical protein MI702_13065 [Chlorobiales bacterium]|nr:hypothetical protein [Chlorobiales bacterium]